MGARIKVGNILEIYDRGDGFDAYVSVEVSIDGKPVRVGTMIGVRASDKDTVRKSGSFRPFLRAWSADSSDLDNVPRADYEAVASALSDETERLWEDVSSMLQSRATSLERPILSKGRRENHFPS